MYSSVSYKKDALLFSFFHKYFFFWVVTQQHNVNGIIIIFFYYFVFIFGQTTSAVEQIYSFILTMSRQQLGGQ